MRHTVRWLRTPPLALAVTAAMAWSVASGCHTSAPSSHGTGGGGVDYNGTTGTGDGTLNGDVPSNPDAGDPSMPVCAPESQVDGMGNCIASCFESGATCADADPTLCAGLPSIAAFDCMLCCEPPGPPTCPPEGCTDPDCPPGEDCSYTATCPDGVCGADEDCSSCPIDCGDCAPSCGDGVCSPDFESCGTCPDDCGACAPGCGDGTCQTGSAGTETCESCPDDCGPCLKVVTWDINAGLTRGTSRVKNTLRAIAGVIAHEKADYVGLESVDKGTARSGKLDEALFIAKHVKMYKRFGAAFNYDGGDYGLGFLSRHPIVTMAKTSMPTSGEWAKRRIVLSATLNPPAYYTDFNLAVTQLAHDDAARLTQATEIAGSIGLLADVLLVGDLQETPGGPALAALQKKMNLLDLYPMFGAGQGFTTGAGRYDYVIAGVNWWNEGAAGLCATVVRTYVKPSKGLANHRPVVALFQQGFTGIDCGTGGMGGDDTGAIGVGNAKCTTDSGCASDPVYRFCVQHYCSECRSDADCTDPDLPTCGVTRTCR